MKTKGLSLCVFLPNTPPLSSIYTLPFLTSSPFYFKKMEAVQSWISQHKLTTIGTIWAAAMGTSLAYSRARTPFKPSLSLIHARMHAQALTLAVLSGAAAYHYYEKRAEEKATK